MRIPLIYQDRPIFGFDLGTRTAKMVQLKRSGKGMGVIGYGFARFPEDAITEGIIVDPAEIAKALKPLLAQMSFGEINAHRVAAALPVAKVFTRVLELPEMEKEDLDQAVKLEAEQYVPVPLPDLYTDYEVIDHQEDKQEVLMVAAPRAVVDSYIKMFDMMGLEVAAVEPGLTSATRAIVSSMKIDKPTLLLDIGSRAIDLAVIDNKKIRLADTVPMGGDTLTQQLVKDLGVGWEYANKMKRRFGIGPSGLQPKIVDSLGVPLGKMCAEIRRVIKFYESRGKEKRKIGQLVVAGGSASIPGFLEYLQAEISKPISLANPWEDLALKHIQGVSKVDSPMYTTAIGLARLEGMDYD